MAKSEKTVEELVSMLERNELQLPEMQRRYVWRSTRVRDLLDSLYRGYPSGAILLWETNEEVPLQDFAFVQQAKAGGRKLLLLDGQQRLTSLAAVIRGKAVTVRKRCRPIEILFNLEHPEELEFATDIDEDAPDLDDEDYADGEDEASVDELQERFKKMTFVVATKNLGKNPCWVKVTDVFNADNDTAFLQRAGVTNFDHPNFDKYSKRLAKLKNIRKYSYRMDILEHTLSYDEVTEIFVRVNSLGAKLRSSDLALAQITAKWRGSLEVFQIFQNSCKNAGFDLDLGIFIKSAIVFATGQCRFLTLNNLNVTQIQNGWQQSEKGMEFALNFIRSNVKIDSVVLLSSPFLLITLAYYGFKKNYQLSPQEATELRRWVLLANTKARYSRGSTESLLDQDISTLKHDGTAKDLIDRLKTQVGRLDITVEELEGKNQRSSLFKTMFLAFKEAGAKDWASNLEIALDHKGAQHKLQFHHIFPKAILKSIVASREADDIANLAFIGGKTNRKISDKYPSDYFPKIVEKNGEGAFSSQCIPMAKELLQVEHYKKFITERRQFICERLNEFLGETSKVRKAG